MRKLVIAAAAGAALATVPAAAQPVDVLVVEGGRATAAGQRLVRYGDLQLASSADRRTLQHRVGLAIADLCDPSRFSVAEPHGAMTCSRQAWTAVEPRLRQLRTRLAAR